MGAAMVFFGVNLSRCAYTGDWLSENAAGLIATGGAAWFLISRCRLRSERHEVETL